MENIFDLDVQVNSTESAASAGVVPLWTGELCFSLSSCRPADM
ncbi:FDLD family class I lanthipeptide [Tumebacillus sp. ITR2]|uniref:FDLD family class I lanthipeptide n=1 Tax=Tumebacillus amylolyticus TaxID=2801339 RepID=A0ABS1JCK7_9BACL|nr:FDLD family class I lanthipeptide [Tumebacillus amylolyticus]